jgi:potassium-transporting ATPase potassium-binding subunit
VSVASAAQYAAFLLVVTVLVRPLGGYLARVFSGESTWLDPVLRPLERALYRAAGVDAGTEMDWKTYAVCFVVSGLGGTLLVYAVVRVQPIFHTFDPLYRPGPVAPDLAMNTALSFATTTSWQAYAGESSMSYLSQIVGLTAQNFVAGAAGWRLASLSFADWLVSARACSATSGSTSCAPRCGSCCHSR